ncbi:hypothetical protein HCG51_30045 [Tolypothrix sp. PCC 7910]|uniref:hypothetical protein n=1 Tax=Tolypothrix sp. PCC 7910 TaxID=2099387 RepID=UPI0014279013|nr:hypothetical protein [Tolypothrix sp. PCC 7910]QIR40514.1 hypothetical protein HCG51_30045 [Tolypothrix sp. PCC 7910]
MFELGWFSAKLFFKGRLLRDPMHFIQKIAIAIAIYSFILLSLEQTTMPFWLPIVISSIVTGAAMPFLLKDFKTK